MLGNANKYAILRMVCDKGPISRADLARELNISPPSISNNITSLIEAALIQEVGSGSADIGRKPILLQYNKTYRYVVGVDIGETSIKLAIANISSEIVCNCETAIIPEQGAQNVLSIVKDEIHKIILTSGIPSEKIGVIVVSVPGIVQEESGEITLSTVIGQWEGIHIGEYLGDAFNKPVIIGNDVDMAILGEHCAGRGKGHDNLVYIKMGDGLAARIILNGKIFHGMNNSAGEIGYMLPDKYQVQDSFSNRGAMERCVCNDKIDSDYRESCAKVGIDCGSDMITIAKLLEMTEENDEIASGILRHMLNYLSLALVNLSSVLNVDLIILGGDAEAIKQPYLDEISNFLTRHIPFVPSVVTSSMEGMAGLAGCIYRGVRLLEDEMSSLW